MNDLVRYECPLCDEDVVVPIPIRVRAGEHLTADSLHLIHLRAARPVD